jgi:putative tricarboxylic transport membrane protein
MRTLRADTLLAVVVIVVAALYLYLDARLPTARIGDPLGPKAFPALVGGGLILAALLLLLETWKKRRTVGSAAVAPRPAAEKTDDRHVALLLAGMVAWTALYYFWFERLGYLIATPLFILGLLSYFNRRRHATNVAVAAGFTIVVYLLFSTLLGVPLPSGPLPI